MEINSEPYDPKWTRKGPNVFDNEQLQRVQFALNEDWVCGRHLYYGAGRSGDSVAFSNYHDYVAYIERATPGDLFILWSVSEIRRRGLLLIDAGAGTVGQADGSLLSPDDLRRVMDYLTTESAEVLGTASFGSAYLESVLTDLDGSAWERFLSMAHRAETAGGSLRVLPYTTIHSEDFYLLKAKRPNENGEVPLGGAY